MTTVKVEVEQDHLARLIKSPRKGIAEVLWNALDADASEVAVAVAYNDAGGPESLTVTDNGTGITRERASLAFGRLGGSWKQTATSTEAGRALHGRLGQGRYSAYALGEAIRWDSIADGIENRREHLVVDGHIQSLDEYQVSDVTVMNDHAPTGTSVTIDNLNPKTVKELDRPGLLMDLTATFALYLQQYPVRIDWLGTEIDPGTLQISTTPIPLDVTGVEGSVVLTIIEWSVPVERTLHLCNREGASLTIVAPNIQAPGFEFTAYVSWKGFEDRLHDVLLGDMAEEPIASVLAAAREALRSHFKVRTAQRGRDLIEAWKADDTYPYATDPIDPVEKAERDLFEVVAVAAAQAVEASDKRSRRFALRLLREALETSPAGLQQVLAEVLSLPADRVEEFRVLLERTTLSAVISSARAITDRLDFLAGLEELVFDADLKKRVKERSELHRILANETWLFREEYVLTADDTTLTTALRTHIGLLGREDLVPADVEAEVLDTDGRRMVVDLMLSRVIEHQAERRDNVVIELKRPSIHVGSTQLSQIENYAVAVASDPRFAKTDTTWEFWIVGDQLEPLVEVKSNQDGRESGITMKSGNITVRAVTWAALIRTARHRLNFVRQSLNLTSAADDGFAYLERAHGQYVPSLPTKRTEEVPVTHN